MYGVDLKLVITYLLDQTGGFPQRRYTMILRSTMGPIDVYLVRSVPFISIIGRC